jgi:hypothetical protein
MDERLSDLVLELRELASKERSRGGAPADPEGPACAVQSC